MLRTRRLSSPACWAAGLVVLSGLGLILPAAPASADSSDGTLTVVVERDVNGDGVYDEAVDVPQAGIEVAVSDAVGTAVTGTTGADGAFNVPASSKLSGGRYFVVAQIPSDLDGLAPVPESKSFKPLSTTVDVSSEDQTVRMGVSLRSEADVAPGPAPQPTPPAPDEPEPTDSVANQPEPSDPGPRGGPRFAVGDDVFVDVNRSGGQDPGEPGAAEISVQLLDADASVLASTVTSAVGRYRFDGLPAGTYSVRFAGLPRGFTFTTSGRGDPATDSNPDYTGATPPFTLGAGESNVRAATAADAVSAGYLNPTVDAGITGLRYAVGDQVWLDDNRDGLRQPEEPAESATVTLLSEQQAVVASTVTDAQGHYRFTDLPAGRYRIRFTDLPPHRAFTVPTSTHDPVVSKPDRRTGLTPVFSLDQDAPDLVPAAAAAGVIAGTSAGAAGVDFILQTMNAGLVPVYSLGDTVWLDHGGDGVLDAGDGGLAGVTVRLLDGDRQVLASRTTTANGRFTFADLPGGNYRLQFSGLPAGFVFTAEQVGTNTAVDSDAARDGMTPVITIGEDNPADTTVDAGLTRPGNLLAPAAGAGTETTADTTLSRTGGVAVQVPGVGLALVLAALACLFVGYRRRT